MAGVRRMRRLRADAVIREALAETRLVPAQLIQPLFVVEGTGQRQPIDSMPGQARLSIDLLCEKVAALRADGVGGVALFPLIDAGLKTEDGREALNPQTLILRAARALKAAVPDMPLYMDLALDPYTTHGHDGVLTQDGAAVDNDRTVDILAQMAVLTAQTGAEWVAPSDMMDLRVRAIRLALDAAGHTATGILAYSAKFNSAYYGPFRDAVGSSAAAGTRLLGKHGYQLDPRNRRQALADALLDADEAADMLMVKPAGPYLDILRELRDSTRLPLAAYQVSGEYAQICAAAQLGWLDRARCRDESLLAIRRAGADIILTYFAGEIAALGGL